MNISIYLFTLFWAFVLGFLLGFSFPIKKKCTVKAVQNRKIADDGFSAINEEYRNFLSYDGTKQ